MSCLIAGLALVASASVADMYLANARVVDPGSERILSTGILIHDREIVALTNRPPPSPAVRTVDLDGKWVIPGLKDMHVHSWGSFSPVNGPDLDLGFEKTARLQLLAGVTAILDLGGPENTILPLRDWIRDSRPVAAALFAAGPVFAHGDPDPGRTNARRIRDPAMAEDQVRTLADTRPDVIKIIYDGEHDQRMSRAMLEALIDTAHDLGFKTVVHIATVEDVEHALGAGTDVLTHLPNTAPISAELARKVRVSGAIVIPTMAVQCDLANIVDQPHLLDSALLHEVATAVFLDTFRDFERFLPIPRRWVEWQRRNKQNYYDSLRNLHAAGVPIVAGSDAANFGTFQGYSLHRELQLMVDACMTPWAALRSATTMPGLMLGREFGFEPGAPADLVVLNASPIPNIANTERIYAVIRDGKLVDRAKIRSQLFGAQ